MSGCMLCPRKCGADREHGQKGFCKVTEILVARASLHFWEEPCISGTEGSGTVFFSGCNLGCVFCQNREISGGEAGIAITVERLAEIFLELQEKGANNINLVTPMHVVLSVREALLLAKTKGLSIPVLVNTGGYDSADSLKLLEGLVDIYLPDMKYISSELSKEYSHAADYGEVAKQALAEMYRQVGDPEFDERGMMKKGMIVRHLLLPGCRKDSEAVLRYLHKTYGNHIYISMMNQFTPNERTAAYPKINRRITTYEYEKLLEFAEEIGIENGFYQTGKTAEESFIPAFDCEGVEKE